MKTMAGHFGQPLEKQLKSGYIRGLSGEKLTQAEEAKQAAVDILKDAEAKGMYGFPVSFHYTCSKPVDQFNFCCIPTQMFLKDLLQTMQKVVFKEDKDPEKSDVFAYVYLNDKTCTVYLCSAFWNAPDHLCMDSKPGTLIHEVSHLLGTDDITYENLKVMLYEDHGTLMGWSGPMSGDTPREEGHPKEVDVQINANSVEYEFETMLNHEGQYRNGTHSCCGETKKHSVCRRRETGYYHLYKRFPHQKVAMAVHLADRSPGMVRYTKVAGQACKKVPI